MRFYFVVLMLLLNLGIEAKIAPNDKTVSIDKNLLNAFSKPLSQIDYDKLQSTVLGLGGKSIATLVQVMKGDSFPDKSRWLATFLVGKIMGKESSSFLVKFLNHPNWILRLASLKTLLALKQDQFVLEFANSLKDESLLVRKQALENIRYLKIKEAAPYVWSMLYDKKNYYINKESKKRTNLIRDAVKTVGELEFSKAREPLFTMIQKEKYQDIFSEIDFSLEKITGKKSPKKNLDTKRRFWKKIATSYQTI